MAQATQVGMVGLGKMGAGMATRLEKASIDVKSFDPAVPSATASSIDELIGQLNAPRVIWLMIPYAAYDRALPALLTGLEAGDIVVDGGNSNYRDSQLRGKQFADRGIHFVDCGVSGGVWGEANGYPLMYGGPVDAVAYLEPVWEALSGPSGRLHCGPVGSGHKVKAVHNAIEYSMMQGIAEGFELMASDPDYTFDLHAIAELWNKGSVIRSWLMELAGLAFAQEGNDLAAIKGYVDDTGEGRWMLKEAIDAAVPMPALAASLFARFSSRQDDSFTAKVEAALRNQFGGHAVVKTDV